MAEKETIWNELKQVFKDASAIFEPTKQSFADYKAEDGSIIRTDTEEIAIGSALQVITPDGVVPFPAEVQEVVVMINEVPNKLYIENGKVTGIEPVAAEAEELPTDPNANPLPEGEAMANENFATKEEVALLTEKLSAIEAKLAEMLGATQSVPTLLADANAQILAQNELNKKLFAAIEKYADAPSVKPTAPTHKEHKPSSLNTLEEFRKSIYK